MNTRYTRILAMTALAGGLGLGAHAQSARVQIIHNSADAAAAEVDIYVNSELAIEDLGFRKATSFLDIPAGVSLDVGVAPGSSMGPEDIIATFNFTLDDGQTYVIVANGIVSGEGYEPLQPFDLDVFVGARETASVSGNTDILVCHGSTDAPIVDVAETSVPVGEVVGNLAYGEFAPIIEVPTGDYVLEVLDANGGSIASYSAPLLTLDLADQAITVVASGFVDPSLNSDGAPFGLFAALPSGGTLVELPLYLGDLSARVQIIHNCADAAASIVDIYVDDELVADDLNFRKSTPFVDLPAGVEITVGVAPGTSTGPEDAIATFNFTLEDGETYVIVANGIISPTGYSPAPAFDLDVFTPAEEFALNGETAVLVSHGATDAPTVDVAELAALGGLTLVDDLAYGEFAGYLAVPTANYALQVQTSDGTPVATYDAPLAELGLDGVAITVVASGFLNPANNSNGPAFGLYASLPGGGGLVQLPLITNVSITEVDQAPGMTIWPNPASTELNIRIESPDDNVLRATITDLAGRVVVELPTSVLARGMNRLSVSVDALSEGLYTLNIFNAGATRSVPVHILR